MRTNHRVSIRRGGTLICLTALWLTFASVASAAPNIIDVSPTSGANTGSTQLTITGTGFVSGASAVLQRTGQSDIAGTSVTVTLFGTQVQATFNLTAVAPGDWDVRVTNPDTTSDVCTACFTVTASAPTVTSASPSSRGQGATAQNITITGTNFAHGAQATFSGTGITVNSTTFVGTTQLTANITLSPTATVGARNVTVTNTDNQSGSCAGCFTVNAAPVVTSVAPAQLPNTASAQLTFTGTGFVSGISVQLELAGQPAVPGTAVAVVNATTMTATFDITDVAPGDWDVHVTNADAGTSVCAGCFTITASDPEVTSASPASRGQGATDQDIAIIGSDFAMGASVSFSGTGITVNDVTFVDSGELTANITISPTATTGFRDITVTNTDGQSGLCTGCFTVNAGPTVTGAVPSSRGQGATSQNITISGTDFVDGAVVSFSGTGITVNSTTFVLATQLTANITISPTAATGVRDVIVTNPDAGADTCPGCFTVNTGPTVTGTDPSSLGQGATTEDVTVTGTGFVNGAIVSFSGTGITVTNTAFVDATELTATVTILGNAATGLRDVTVTNPDGGKKTCVGCFTVNAAPTVTDVTPDNLGQGASDQDLTITGTGFQDGATVSFSGTGITVDDVTFVDATELTVNVNISGAATPGARDVTITNPDAGTPAVCEDCFSVNAAPTTTSVSPNDLGQGATDVDLTVTGTGFQDGATVEFSGTGITVNDVTFVSPTTLTVNVTVSSTATTGARTVSVTNPDEGTPATCVACFTVNTGPTVTDVSPSAATNTEPVELTLTGTGFAPGASIHLERTGQSDIVGTSVVVTGPTEASAEFEITAAAPGDWDVVFTNADEGTTTCVACFTIGGSAPSVGGVSPASRGQGATDEDITVTGLNFAMGAVVSFSGTGITINDTTFVDSTELTVNITISGTAPTGARNVTVTNTDAQAGTCTGCFTVNAKPNVTDVIPDSLAQGATEADLSVIGTGFQSTATVEFSGTGITVNGTTFVNATKIVVNVTLAPAAPVGARNVTVTNPDGGTPAVCTGCFTVREPMTAMTPGVVRGNVWYLADEAPPGAVSSFAFGRSTDTPIVGDWDGDGDHEPGVVRGNIWYLADEAPPVVVSSFAFGRATDTPIVGDWDGQGGDEIGVVRGNVWFLAEDVPPTVVNSFAFGRATDTQIVGDWDGQGGDEIGVVRGNVWYLANDVPPTSVSSFAFGRSTDTPITGDFDGDGDDEIGVVRENVWYFADEAPPTGAFSFAFGRATDIKIIGDWDGP
jgi:hypothetical protein